MKEFLIVFDIKMKQAGAKVLVETQGVEYRFKEWESAFVFVGGFIHGMYLIGKNPGA